MTDPKALGVHSMWGFSPAFDAGSLAGAKPSDSTDAEQEQEPFRVLFAAPSDIRHVLATLSRRRRHGTMPVHMVVTEKQLEVLARDLLMLQIACDWELPIRQRSTVFLEVFGNTLLQERTQAYVHRLGQELVELVCDSRGPLAELVDLNGLKYRDRDGLVEVFKAWDPSVPFDAVGLRDYRLRGHFGQRYDNRVGLVDWDYYARVKPTASIIHQRLYKEWRLSGVAFEFGDQKYDQPNRTLGSYVEGVMKKGKDKGLKKEVRGYWIDVVNSPYISMGVQCDRTAPYSDSLFEVSNKDGPTEQHKHHAVEVAVYNMLAYLSEIETGTPYAMTKPHDLYSGLGEDASDLAWHAANEAAENGPGAKSDEARRAQALTRARCIVETLSACRVSLVNGGVEHLYGNKATSKGGFHVIHLSVGSAHHLDDANFASLLANKNAKVVVERAHYLVPLTAEQEALYDKKIVAMATARGLVQRTSASADVLEFGVRDVTPPPPPSAATSASS